MVKETRAATNGKYVEVCEVTPDTLQLVTDTGRTVTACVNGCRKIESQGPPAEKTAK